MNKTSRNIVLWILSVAIVIVLILTFTNRALAHHGQPGESSALAHSRDLFYVRYCDNFRYEGESPDRAVCMALLSAVHHMDYHGRRADRRWVSSAPFLKLIKKESGYSHSAVNPSSGACGLGQMLPCDKYGPGSCWRALQKQANCVVKYTLGTYRTPANAWNFWQVHHWY